MYSTISLYAVNYNLTSHIAKQWRAYNILNSQNIPHPALVESYKVFYSELKYRIMRGLCYVCYKDLSTYYSDTAPLRSGLTHGKGNNNSIVAFSNIQIAKKKTSHRRRLEIYRTPECGIDDLWQNETHTTDCYLTCRYHFEHKAPLHQSTSLVLT